MTAPGRGRAAGWNPVDARGLAAVAGVVHRFRIWEDAGRALRALTHGRLARHPHWPPIPDGTGPWQDTVCAERAGWRTREAYLHGDVVFAVDHRSCRHCRLAWVQGSACEHISI